MDVTQRFQQISFLPNEKLSQWRENDQNLSQQGLAKAIRRKAEATFGNIEKIPARLKVHPPDISNAENGNVYKFRKVTDAIYELLDVPKGYFGELDREPKMAALRMLEEESSSYVAKYTDLQRQLIEIQQKNAETQVQLFTKLEAAFAERESLLKRIWSLEMEIVRQKTILEQAERYKEIAENWREIAQKQMRFADLENSELLSEKEAV